MSASGYQGCSEDANLAAAMRICFPAICSGRAPTTGNMLRRISGLHDGGLLAHAKALQLGSVWD